MTRRNLAAKGRQDSNHKAIADAIRALGYPVMDLSAAGNGVEDLLVGLKYSPSPCTERELHGERWWVVVECKVPRNKAGTVQPSQYKPAQLAWRELTQGWPRITVTSGQEAVTLIRDMTG